MNEKNAPERVKLVIVGDGASGKTSLLTTFSSGIFPNDYVPTIFENSVVTMEVEGKQIDMELWDTAGQEEYDKLRKFSFDKANVILIAFSLDNRQSLENVQGKWISEVLYHTPDTPIILVGMKSDLKTNISVSTEQGKAVAVELTSMYISPTRLNKYRRVRPTDGGKFSFPYLYSVKYLECSSKENTGVNDVFQHAVRAALLHAGTSNKKKRRNIFCNLL